MKVILTAENTIKGNEYEPGDEVIVKKEYGERLISEGLANRVIDEVENRVEEVKKEPGVLRYSGHRVIYSGSDGRKYEKQGADFVEIEE